MFACVSVFYHIFIWNPSACFFFPLCLSQAFTHSRPLQETCPQHTILIRTTPNQFLHLSRAASSASWLSPRGADASTLSNPQIIPNLLNELRSARKHVPLRSKVNPVAAMPLPLFPLGKVWWVTADDAWFFWLALRIAVSSDKFSPWAIYWGITLRPSTGIQAPGTDEVQCRAFRFGFFLITLTEHEQH